jgi:hypothetical protein
MAIIKCNLCGKEINRMPSRIHKTNFCNNECRIKFTSKVHEFRGVIKDTFSNSWEFLAKPLTKSAITELIAEIS